MDRKKQIEYYKQMEQKELEHQEQVRGVQDEPINDRHLAYLKCVLISQLLLEANDDLKGSKAFKQNVKLQVNKTSNILENVYQDGFNAIYNNNPEMCTNVLNKIDSLMHSIKTATIDELVMIEALVKQYKENKEEINKTQITEFTKLD
jgi:Cu2+-containing amine oxidase